MTRTTTMFTLLAGLCATILGCDQDYAIVPANAQPLGKSYAEWSVARWQWAFSLPIPRNPIADGGADCSEGQSGPVWFLAGALDGAVTTRECTVPAKKAVFFSPIAVECSKLEGSGETEEELRACANADQDAVSIVDVEIDGEPIPDVKDDFRFESDIFDITLPDDNLMQLWGVEDAEAGFYPDQAVSDGRFLMVLLAPGEHTIHWHAVIPDSPDLPFGGFEEDVTYNLTVEDEQ
jgi:hypothetical protein